MANKFPDKPETPQKAQHCEKSLMTCQIKTDSNNKKRIQLNIDAKYIPSHIKTHEDALEYVNNKLFGTGNTFIAHEICQRASEALPSGLSEERRYNIILNSSQEIEPKDVIESRLSAKEAVLYTTAMHYMKRAENALESDSLGSSLWYETFMKFSIKLLRLHNETVDALSKYRRQGEQRVIVQHQHVNVEEGGKAIVGQLIGG